LLALSF